MLQDNIILKTDSYKASHWKQYPYEARYTSFYIEPRWGSYEQIVFFGLQAFMKEYLTKVPSKADIEEAEEIITTHGEPFNREGWEKLNSLGYWPIEIEALPEGTVHGKRVAQVQVRNTHPDFPWLPSYLETAMLRGVWYPSTVATVSYNVKQTIKRYLNITVDDEKIAGVLPFRLHDFGARGVSSGESAALGGLAHLVNFLGTDTMEALVAAKRFYNENVAGFSIPASEHSTITSWGPQREAEAYLNMLRQYGDGALLACVSDSYDIQNAVENLWGGLLKNEVQSMQATLVVRPDSGDPIETPLQVIKTLMEKFGYTKNRKGFYVLNDKVRVIQGDGMNPESIEKLLKTLMENKISAENIAFGMGGGLLQKVNRDTLGYVMKMNALSENGITWKDVFKKPTDLTKESFSGRVGVFSQYGKLITQRADQFLPSETNLLQPVYENGRILKDMTLSEIRDNAK